MPVRERTGEWPTLDSGAIPGTDVIMWYSVDNALRKDGGVLDASSSLSRLLTAERGVIPMISRLTFTEEDILAWADAWRDRTGRWPTKTSGDIPGLGGVNWSAVDGALRHGRCGLSGGSSLARLLARERGRRNIQDLPRLTVEQILAWADEHHQRTGEWPRRDSGAFGEAAPRETWKQVDIALNHGLRGLPGGSSLPHLLARRRGVRSKGHLAPFSERQILAWAAAHHARRGGWPNSRSGPILEAPGETWLAVESALWAGLRGLPGGSSLSRLLAERRGVRNVHGLPRLTTAQILGWADAHHARTGQWPKSGFGPIAEALGETWGAVHQALYRGLRGLPGGSSLARLLARERGVRNAETPAALPRP